MESNAIVNPIGLYYDPESKQYLGAIDEIQADAMVRAGWTLHTEGRDAAMTTQEDIDVLMGKKKAVEPAEDTPAPGTGSTYEPDNKKGK